MLGPYELNRIYTGDARVLAEQVPDESVDLIFTDPVYDRIDDYRWLAETAARVLRPEGVLLCWSNGKWHKTHTDWLEDFGLVYRYTFTTHMIRAVAPMNGYIVSKCNRVLWFDVSGTSGMLDYVADGYPERNKPELGNHKWAKSPAYTHYLLEGFALPGAVILDPFTGGGTVPAVCCVFGYRYLAFEIDPDTAARARERVRNTQPPLPIAMPVQEMMLL